MANPILPKTAFDPFSAALHAARRADRARMPHHAKMARRAGVVTDVARGIAIVAELVEQVQVDQAFDDAGPPLLNDGHVGLLMRFVIASAELLADDADRLIEWVEERAQEAEREAEDAPCQRSAEIAG